MPREGTEDDALPPQGSAPDDDASSVTGVSISSAALRMASMPPIPVPKNHKILSSRGLKRKAGLDDGTQSMKAPELTIEEEREIQVSKLSSLHIQTNQFVCNENQLPKGFTQETVEECFFDIPPFQWDRIEFLSVIEDISRLQNNEFGSCLWGNKFTSDFTIGGCCAKPLACYDKLNRFHQLHFETDGPSMMFTVITEGVDLHPGLLDVIRVAHNISEGGKSHCLTNFTVQTNTTLMKYRGDNASSKADSVRVKLNRSEIEGLHYQLKEVIQASNRERLEEMEKDDNFSPDDMKEMLAATYNTSTLNYTLVVDNFLENNQNFVISKGILDASVEMRMVRCQDSSGVEKIFVAQSVLLRSMSGVDPYSAFIESMNSLGPRVRKSVWSVLDGMVKCLNKGNMLSDSDIKTMMHWITAPSFLCMMLYNWSVGQELEILSSDVPVATEGFGRVVLGCVHKDVQRYVGLIEQKMNQCKATTKMKQIKIVAEVDALFRGVYVMRNEDGVRGDVVCAPLPPATFSFSLNLGEDWLRDGLSVGDVTRNCIFATLFRVICDPRLAASNAFRGEMQNLRCSANHLESLRSPEARWAFYMISNVEEQRDEPGMEVKDAYLRTIGKHHSTNRMFSVMLDIALKSKEYTSVLSTANLVIHRISEQASISESPVQAGLVRALKVLAEDAGKDGVLKLLGAQLGEILQTSAIPSVCMWETPLVILQRTIQLINRVFRLKNSNLNLLYILLTNTISYTLPKEPAWATTIMLVDAACQSELVVQDKGRTRFLGVAGSKRDSAGFNFTQVCFEQMLSSPFLLAKTRSPDMVVSGANYTDGKKKRMGLTLALKNDQRVDPEDTVPLCEYGKLIFVSEDCHTLIQNTGQAKTFLREACSKKSDADGGAKTGENYNKKLMLMEEPRIMLIATNRKETEMGDVFSLAARLRFFESAAEDTCVPLKTSEQENHTGARLGSDAVTAVSTTSARFSLAHDLGHLLARADGRGKESVDLNLTRSRQNALLIVVQHACTAIAQLFTLSGFRLYCNENNCVSRMVQKEVNAVLFRILEPILSSDVNEEDRFVRKQEGLMLSLAVPMHIQAIVLRKLLAQTMRGSTPDLDALVRDSIMELIFSDLSLHCMVSAYVSNVTYDSFMYVMMRCCIRKLELPTGYTLPLLVRLVEAGSIEGIDGATAQEMAALTALRVWVQHRMKFLVQTKDLYSTKPREVDSLMDSYLGIREHWTSAEGRSNFIADAGFFASGQMEDAEGEEAGKNIWKTIQGLLIGLPEVQNAFSSFRLRREMLSPELLQMLFGAKRLNRACMDTIFGREGFKFVELLQALGVPAELVPAGWKKMSLHSALRDEGNRNSNIFNLVYVGRTSCVLTVNVIALVLLAPLFQTENHNILHQLQQKHTTCKAVEFAITRKVPRAYWPRGALPVLQVDHLGKWISFRLPEEEALPPHRWLFPRIHDIEWHGVQPRMKGNASTITPFFEEETAVCGSMVGMAKRMREGMELTDDPIPFFDYLQMIDNFRTEGPDFFMQLDYDAFNLYVLVTPEGQYVLCKIIDDGAPQVDIHLFNVNQDFRMERADVIRIPLSNMHTALMRMRAYPYPRIFCRRLVFAGGRYRDRYEGLEGRESIAAFGVILAPPGEMILGYDGTYTVELYDLERDEPFTAKLYVCNLHHVLVGELQRMILPASLLPRDKIFLPTHDEDGLVYVHHVPAERPSVCLGMSYCKDGEFEDSLETMLLEVHYRHLLEEGYAEETEDMVCDNVGFTTG